MNLAFCNQEKQRNEVCCGLIFLHPVLNDSLKPVEISIPIAWLVQLSASMIKRTLEMLC
jgi:hypothetical protein